MKKFFLSIIALAFAINISHGQNTPWSTTGSIGIGTTSPKGLLGLGNQSVVVETGGLTLGYGGSSIEFVGSNFGLGYGHKIYSVDPSNGAVDLRFAVRQGSTSWTDAMTIRSDNGNVGMGTTTPGPYKLALSSSDYRILSLNSTYGQINADFANNGVYFGSIGSGVSLTSTAAYNDFGLGTAGTTGNLIFATGTGFSERMRVTNGGNVLIGQTTQHNTAYILDVWGSARANEIVVNATGADFVFNPSYKLNSLPALEKYIKQNHHLPEIPSASEMKANGLSLGANQARLLQKVEELTLYLIEKDKEIEQLKSGQKRNSKQQKEIDELKQEVKTLLKPKR